MRLGGQDGISNLHHCSPEQLSFLMGHLKAKNEELKSMRDAAKEKRLKLVARELEKYKKYQELQHQAMEERKADEAANSKEEDGNEDKTAAGWDSDYLSRSPSPVPSVRPPVVVRGRRNRNRGRRFRSRYQTWEPLPGQIQVEFGEMNPLSLPKHLQAEFEKLYPPALSKEALYEMVSPVEQGTDWTLEAVGVDLAPDIDNSRPQPVFPVSQRESSVFPNPGWNPTPTPAYTQKPTESAKTTFRAFYRRTILTCVAQEAIFRHENSRYVCHDVTMVDDIASGDYADLQGEYVQTEVGHEGGKAGDERDDDLEIVVEQEADEAEDGGT